MILLTNPQKIYISITVFITLIMIFLSLLFLYKKYYLKKHLKEGTYLTLSSFANDNDFLLLNNYKIQYDSASLLTIDHVLISKKYIFLINDYPLSGLIKGELKSPSLKVINSKGIKNVTNPMNLSINLTKRFNLYHSLNSELTKAIIVINNDSKIEINNDSNQFLMVPLKNLKKTILNLDKVNVKNLKEESIIKFINKLNELNENEK